MTIELFPQKSQFEIEDTVSSNFMGLANVLDECSGSGGDGLLIQPKTLDTQTRSINTLDLTAAMASPAVSPSRMMKTRQHLQLPPFKSLGIAAPHPDVLLTPPDEHDTICWTDPFQKLPHIPTSSPCSHLMRIASEGTTPETPLVSEFVSAAGAETPKSSQPTASQVPVPMTSQGGEGLQDLPASNTQSDNSQGRTTWLADAVEVTCRTNQSHIFMSANSSSINHLSSWRLPTCDQRALPHPALSIVGRRLNRSHRLYIHHLCSSSPSWRNRGPLYRGHSCSSP